LDDAAEKNIMKQRLYISFSLFLMLGGCREREQPSHFPIWELTTIYPVSFLQNIDEQTIGASVIDRYLLLDKASGQVNAAIPVTGSSIAGMVWEGQCLYYGTSDRFFRCYDTREKRVVWETATLLENEALPAIDANTVYAGSRDHTLYAFDKYSGIIKWRFETAGPVYVKPVLYDSLVLIGSWDTHLYALQRETGQEIWKFTAQAGIDQLPLMVNGILWLANYDYHIYGIDPHDGKTLFTFTAENAFEFSGAVWNHNILFSGIDRKIYTVDAVEGQLSVWGESPLAISTSILVQGDLLFTGQYDGALYSCKLPEMTKSLWHRFDDRVTTLLSDGQYLWAASWDRHITAFTLQADNSSR
jgi:outer membrane protein assembly factor BamB